jgi:hypothetical protein
LLFACGTAKNDTTGSVVADLGTSDASVAAPAGLVAAYGFNEGSGGTLVDLSGNHLNGTIVGATWTSAGKYGNALSFDGQSNYVDLGNPTALRLSGSLTLEAWVKATATPPDDGQIVSKSDGPGWQLKTSPDTGVHTFGAKVTSTSGAPTWRYSTTVRSLDTWYHVASVYDASAQTLSVYVNGVPDNGVLRGTVPSSEIDRTVNVNIGRRTGGYYFAGIIDEVRIYNRALSQSEVQTDMITPLDGAPAPSDSTPPTVSLTSPANGATVTGTVSVTASASDNVGVAGVRFLLDGANLGSEVTTAPYGISWDTSTASAGNHVLSAVARDTSNNTTTSAAVNVKVSAASGQIGQWSAVASWPIVAVHASLLPSGNVLAWTDYTINGGAQIWRPATNTFTDKTYDLVNLFCAGHAYMADGRLMIVGGTKDNIDDLGPQDGTIFDPSNETWSDNSWMKTGRYYPTATTLPDGRILVLGGTTTCAGCIADMPEVYDPVTNAWTELAESARMSLRYYPHPFVVPDGRVVVAGSDDAAIDTKALDLDAQTWSTIDSRVFDGHSSAMYLPGKIVKAGHATADDPGHPASATTYVLDMNQPSPAWEATALMAFPRSYLNLTILPDGTVLATGGGTTTDKANFSTAVYEAELWSPTTRTWTTMARMQTPRLYHSTALLLPDARVLVAGGGRENGRSQPDPADRLSAEIFSPPYLLRGPRPVITSAPSAITYGATFTVSTPDAARVRSVSLVGLGAVTHAFNENQRFVPLTFTAGSSSLNVVAPAGGNLAPPGPYMLFLVDTNGVPSIAAMVRVAAGGDTQSPTPPSHLAASASAGLVNLTWSASTDNVGVTGYNVHRSTASGFAPAPANKIGQVSATSYTDAAVSAPGTYYYVVTAQDARLNVSAPSNEASAVVTPTTTVPGGLVAAYSFSEGSGTTVSDRSGNNLTGTIIGASWTSGKYGNALSFDGASSYVDLGDPTALQLTGSMTLEGWVNAAEDPPDDGDIVAKSDGPGWQLKTSPDTGVHTFGTKMTSMSGAGAWRYSTTVRALDTWYHVASVYDAAAGTLTIYVNGVADNGTLRGTVPPSEINRSVAASIGRRSDGFYFNGIIDEIRIYNRALSAAEIRADMNAPIDP